MRKTKRRIKNKKITGRKGRYLKQRTVRGGTSPEGSKTLSKFSEGFSRFGEYLSQLGVFAQGRFLRRTETRYGQKIDGIDYGIHPSIFTIIQQNISIPKSEEHELFEEFQVFNDFKKLKSILKEIGRTVISDADTVKIQKLLTSVSMMAVFIYLYKMSKHVYHVRGTMSKRRTFRSDGLLSEHNFSRHRSKIREFIVMAAEEFVTRGALTIVKVTDSNGEEYEEVNLNTDKFLKLCNDEDGNNYKSYYGVVFSKHALQDVVDIFTSAQTPSQAGTETPSHAGTETVLHAGTETQSDAGIQLPPQGYYPEIPTND